MLGNLGCVGVQGPFHEDRDIVLAAVQQNGIALERAAEPLKADRGIVLAAVQQNGVALRYAAEPLKADRGIVLVAVQQEGTALEYAAKPLKADKDIVLAAVLQEGLALQYAAKLLKADRDIYRDIVLAAVQQNGEALIHAANRLNADRDIVLAAVQQNGKALEYAAKPLKADRDIVLAAVQQNGGALEYAAEPLKADRGIVLVAVQQNGWALQCVTEPLNADRDIVLAAVQQNGGALESAAEPLKSDRDIVLAAVQQHQEGWALDASWSLKTLRSGPNELIYDAHTLHSDASFMLSASRLGVRAHTAVARILGADVLRELEAAASAQPSTSQSPSADEHDGAPVPLARVAEVKHDVDKIDEARYAELRRHYCEAYEEHDAPTLAGTSGARLRHKRKCRARIESDSAGYKALRKRIKQLDCISNHAEVYRLLSLLYEYEVHLAPRGIARPAALGGGAPADEVAEVVDLIGEDEENDIIDVDTYILDVLRDKRDEQQVGGAAGPSSAAPLSAGNADGATRVKQERN